MDEAVEDEDLVDAGEGEGGETGEGAGKMGVVNEVNEVLLAGNRE